jgi:lipopolysaccharide export system protein LptC
LRKRYSLLIFLLVALTALVNWWQSDSDTAPSVERRDGHQFPDAYAKQLTITRYDAQGNPRHKLQTPLMRHFPDDRAQIEQPRFWQYDTDDSPAWTLRGERALLNEGDETMLLSGEVFIDRAASDKSPPYHIATRDLTVQTKTAYAETSQPVRIESGDEWITAIGMQGWLQGPVRIKLQQEVRAYYESL